MKIVNNPSLTDHNTFHLPVTARQMAILESETDYDELFDRFNLEREKFLILGEGSNILFRNDFDGLVITSRMDRINLLDQNDRFAWIEVEGGLNWHKFVIETIKMGFQGLENLSLIPGKTGAAPMQNIGAYGVEIGQYIESVAAVDIFSGKTVRFTHQECRFGYRTSIFKTDLKGRFLIRSLQLRLNKVPDYQVSYERIKETLDQMGVQELTAEAISQAIIRVRQSKLPDPAKIGNAGSFFKNPVIDKIDFEGLKAEFPEIKGYNAGKNEVKIPAAWLIEKCGWKGKRKNGAGVHNQHALVLVNHGNATGIEIYELSEMIRQSVSAKFGILLEPEVNII